MYFSFFSLFRHHVIAIAAQDFDHMTFNLSKRSRKVEFKRRCTVLVLLDAAYLILISLEAR
jgi:hypothetical protein